MYIPYQESVVGKFSKKIQGWGNPVFQSRLGTPAVGPVGKYNIFIFGSETVSVTNLKVTNVLSSAYKCA